jgi:hypothetical protein
MFGSVCLDLGETAILILPPTPALLRTYPQDALHHHTRFLESSTQSTPAPLQYVRKLGLGDWSDYRHSDSSRRSRAGHLG